MSNSLKPPPAAEGLNSAWSRVMEFHTSLDLPILSSPAALSRERIFIRSKWMREELGEFETSKSLIDQVDALIDLIYLALGTLVEMGVPPEEAFEIVHQANLAKRGSTGQGRKTAEGKVVKPPGWQGPEDKLSAYLERLAAQLPRQSG